MPGFLVGTTSTFLAATIGNASGQQSRHIVIPARVVLYAVLFIIFVIVLLVIPVIWGAVSEAASSAAEKAAPATFFVGLGVLFIGFVAGFEILDIVGASLAGLVVLGVIVDNYLTAVPRLSSPAGRCAMERATGRRRGFATAGGNEPVNGPVVSTGRSCLVCSCYLHARGERCCGRAASGIWGKSRREPARDRTVRTRTQPL
jgi:hypothetical protein